MRFARGAITQEMTIVGKTDHTGTEVTFQPDPEMFDTLTYDEVLARHLKATDTTAMTLAMDNHMTLICFALKDPENIYRVVRGETIGTIVKED